MYLSSKLYIKFFSNYIGSDEYGNKYYLHKDGKRRFVVYNGTPETSKIPQMWHAWIHCMTDKTPKFDKYHWQGDHVPNTTGTNFFKFKKTKKQLKFWEP